MAKIYCTEVATVNRFLQTVAAGTLSTLLATLIVFIASNVTLQPELGTPHLGSYGASVDYYGSQSPATRYYDEYFRARR